MASRCWRPSQRDREHDRIDGIPAGFALRQSIYLEALGQRLRKLPCSTGRTGGGAGGPAR